MNVNSVSFHYAGIIVGVFWGTIYGLYVKTWLPSLFYMIILLCFIIIKEVQKRNSQHKKPSDTPLQKGSRGTEDEEEQVSNLNEPTIADAESVKSKVVTK